MKAFRNEQEACNRLLALSQEILTRQIEFGEIKANLRKAQRSIDARNGTVTVYKVKETTIKRHTRCGYQAVRVSWKGVR